MTWLKVYLREANANIDRTGRPVGRKVFYCEADSVVTADQAWSANDGTTAVTLWGQAFSATLPTCTAIQVTTDQQSPYQVVVTVDFGSIDPVPFQPTVDLLALPAKISRTDNTDQEEYAKDVSDPPVFTVNTAGEPFDRSPTRLSGIEIYKIEKYVTMAQRNAILFQKRTMNDVEIVILGRPHPRSTLLLAKADETLVGSIFLMNLEVWFNEDEWLDEVASYGWSELVPGTGGPDATGSTRSTITETDANGNEIPVHKPWPLAEDGSKMPNADDDAFVIEFQPYETTSLNAVPLA